MTTNGGRRRSPFAQAMHRLAGLREPACLLDPDGIVLFVNDAWDRFATDNGGGVANPAAFIAFGLALVPFAFLALAFASGHPNAPMATVKAMSLFLLIGIPVSAISADAVTGLVAGAGAGGIAALRASEVGTWKYRALGVLFACVYTFVLARAAGAIILLSVPVFPFTSIGLADHFAERRQAKELAEAPEG